MLSVRAPAIASENYNLWWHCCASGISGFRLRPAGTRIASEAHILRFASLRLRHPSGAAKASKSASTPSERESCARGWRRAEMSVPGRGRRGAGRGSRRRNFSDRPAKSFSAAHPSTFAILSSKRHRIRAMPQILMRCNNTIRRKRAGRTRPMTVSETAGFAPGRRSGPQGGSRAP
jgi:hypothetical protein